MKKIIIGIVFAILQGCCTMRAVLPYASKDMVQYSVQLTTIILNKDEEKAMRKASGFALDKDHILTAGHFCQYKDGETPSKKISIIKKNSYTDKEEKIVAHNIVAVFSDPLDLCVIKKENHGIDILPTYKEPISLSDKIMTIGGPRGYFPVRAYGEIVRTEAKEIDREDSFLSSMKVFPGNSGGMVVNSDGFIVGMVVGYIADFPHVSVVTKMSKICEEIKRINLRCR